MRKPPKTAVPSVLPPNLPRYLLEKQNLLRLVEQALGIVCG